MADGEVYVTFGGDTSALEASAVQAKQIIRSLSSELARSVREATANPGSSALKEQALELSKALTEQKDKFREINAEMKEHFAAAKEGSEVYDEIKEHLKELAELAGIAWTADAIKEWIAGNLEAAEAISNVSHQMGIGVEGVQRLQALAQTSGADFQELSSQFERFQVSLAKVGDKASPVSEALRVLGLNAASLRGQSIDQQISTLAETFSGFRDGPTKTAAAVALFGRAGADLIPILDKGKEGLAEFNEMLGRTGVIMSGETVASFGETKEAVNELTLAWKSLSQNLYSVVNPAVQVVAQQLAPIIESIHAEDIRNAFLNIGQGLIDLGQAAAEFVARASAEFKNLVSVVESVIGPLERIDELLGKVENFHFTTPGFQYDMQTGYANLFGKMGLISPETQAAQIDQATQRLREAMSPTTAGVDRATEDLNNKLKLIASGASAAKDELAKLFAKPGSSPFGDLSTSPFGKGEAAKPQVPLMNLDRGAGAKAAGQAVEEAWHAAEAAADGAEKKIAATLDLELAEHKITTAQWLAGSIDALEKEKQAIQQAAAAAMASSALTANQKTAIATEEQRKLADITTKEIEDQKKAVEEISKIWDQAFKSINSAVTSQISGLLSGTESFRTAMAKVLQDLTQRTIKFFIDWGLEAVENQIKQVALNQVLVAAHVTGQTTMAAADQTASAAGLGATIANVMKAIQAFAAETAAGVTSFMAPIIGPAAPAVGAAAGSTVVAMGGLYDIGAYDIPHDQMAFVHKNELVMPAAQATAFRGMLDNAANGGTPGATGGGGDTHYHLAISAIDAAGVSSLFANNGRALMQGIDKAIRGNHHLGLQSFSK